jgi:hypothetical protein
MMQLLELYNALRTEIVANQVMMHWFSLIVALVLLGGVVVAERRETVLSVFLPLLSVSWAASIVRLDFFIHRQAAYLGIVESQLREQGLAIPMWETWKGSLRATPFVVPVLDLIVVSIIVIPTLYLLFGSSLKVFASRGWRGGRLYACTMSSLLALLLISLAVIPKIARW